mmetsp:Transcript_60892/g.133395  ORF Transcript_60892/g.133395 Transcript_60892/m.133395 type:complete len:228 (-) Transcript_60892:605-1288(-)
MHGHFGLLRHRGGTRLGRLPRLLGLRQGLLQRLAPLLRLLGRLGLGLGLRQGRLQLRLCFLLGLCQNAGLLLSISCLSLRFLLPLQRSLRFCEGNCHRCLGCFFGFQGGACLCQGQGTLSLSLSLGVVQDMKFRHAGQGLCLCRLFGAFHGFALRQGLAQPGLCLHQCRLSGLRLQLEFLKCRLIGDPPLFFTTGLDESLGGAPAGALLARAHLQHFRIQRHLILAG